MPVATPAVMNVRLRRLRTVTRMSCDHRRICATSPGSWTSAGSARAAMNGFSSHRRPSNSSRFSAFQYACWRALTRIISRPSRGQSSGP